MGKGSPASGALQTFKGRLRVHPGTIAVYAVLVMVFVMGLVKIYSADLGFHLKSAAWILEHKQFIYTDSFSYGSDGHAYYDLQWLFQLLVYTLYQMGEPVLVIANALLITFSIALTWFRFSKYSAEIPHPVKAAVFACIALLLVLPLTFETRPHVLSWIYLNLLLLALESYKRGKQKAVFFLPLIMLFWVNSHSLAVLSLVTLGIYNAGLFFESKKIDKKLLLYSTLGVVAFLINPYFLEGLLFPLKQFGYISGSGLTKAYIGEMQSPFAENELQVLGENFFSNPVLLLQYLSVVAVVVCFFRSLSKKNYTDALLLAAYLFLFNLGLKNYGYYLMVSLPLIARHTTGWLEQRLKARQEKAALSSSEKSKSGALAPAFNPKGYNRVAIATVFMAVLISITCINDGYTIALQVQDRFGFREDKDQLPVGATGFLVSNHITGKILNHFNDGGYLMAHANAKVFIDGRIELMDDEFFKDYYVSVTEPEGLKKLLDTFDPDIVVFPYGGDGMVWWNYFLTHKKASGYRPVYFDGLSAIYLRSSGFAQIPELTAQNVLEGLDTSSVKRLGSLIRKPDKPEGIKVWLQSIWKKQALPMDDVKKATFCFANGFETAALVYCVRSLERSTVHIPDVIYYNLSVYYSQKNMYNEAQLCGKRIKGKHNK